MEREAFLEQIKQEVAALIVKAEEQSLEPGSHPMLISSVGILRRLQELLSNGTSTDDLLVRAGIDLFRYVTEDLSFYRSEVGRHLLRLSEHLLLLREE